MAPDTFSDPFGQYEPQDTLYKLTVYTPPRPPPKYLPAIFTRIPVTHPVLGSVYTIKPNNYGSKTPNYEDFSQKDLANMLTKTVKVKAWRFPVKMRCAHVQRNRTCEEGCYVLEEGGDVKRWSCNREDCEGHVYGRNILTDEEGKSCFGKKGKRMVCVRQGACSMPRV
jgi:hypothetical protein